MQQKLENANFSRFVKLAKKLRNKTYRKGYMGTHIKMFLSNQISGLRGNLSQEEFGKLLGKPQSVVSRLQNPTYGKYTLQTLLDIADRMDVALIVRFVDYPTFLKFTNDFSDYAVRPDAFSPEQMDSLATTSHEMAPKASIFQSFAQDTKPQENPHRLHLGGAHSLLALSAAKERLPLTVG